MIRFITSVRVVVVFACLRSVGELTVWCSMVAGCAAGVVIGARTGSVKAGLGKLAAMCRRKMMSPHLMGRCMRGICGDDRCCPPIWLQGAEAAVRRGCPILTDLTLPFAGTA